MPNPARRTIALAALAVAIIAAAVALDLPSAAAQSDDERGRIVAQRLNDGRTEFGWQPTSGARVLPTARYFPADAEVDRWLNSSPVEVDGAELGRINARLRDDGRIEFAFTPTDGERIEPSARYFPVDARVGRWLRSTEIEISAAPAAGFVAVSAGLDHTCAIRDTGVIECWGNNEFGKTAAPTGSFTAVAASPPRTCAIRAGSGAIECWGFHNPGQPANLAGSFTAVAASSEHTCVIRAGSGAIECWGDNVKREWTAGEETPKEIYAGQATPPAGSFTAVAAGSWRTCAIRAGSGAIECWGANDFEMPDALAGSFSAVAASYYHMCGLREDGEIVCFGWGQAEAPTGSFTAVSAGGQNSCAIRAGSGAITCWGTDNRYGQNEAPTGSFTAVSASGFHACAIRESGAIACWGLNDRGQTDAPAP